MNKMIYFTKFLYANSRSKFIILWSFQVLRRALMQAIRKKRPKLSEQIEYVVFHQDNAPANTATMTQLEIRLLGFDEITNSPSTAQIWL